MAGDAGLRSVRHRLAQQTKVRVDLPLPELFRLWGARLPPLPLLRGSDGGFVGPASQALSLPWFATDLGAGVAEMVDAEVQQSSGRKPV